MNSLFMAFLSSSSQSREELGKSMQGGSVAGAGGGASDGGGGASDPAGLGWDAGRREDWICICTKAGTFKGRWGGSVG